MGRDVGGVGGWHGATAVENSPGRVTGEAQYLNRLGLAVAENHHEMPNKAPVWSPCPEAHWLTKGWNLMVLINSLFELTALALVSLVYICF